MALQFEARKIALKQDRQEDEIAQMVSAYLP